MAAPRVQISYFLGTRTRKKEPRYSSLEVIGKKDCTFRVRVVTMVISDVNKKKREREEPQRAFLHLPRFQNNASHPK